MDEPEVEGPLSSREKDELEELARLAAAAREGRVDEPPPAASDEPADVEAEGPAPAPAPPPARRQWRTLGAGVAAAGVYVVIASLVLMRLGIPALPRATLLSFLALLPAAVLVAAIPARATTRVTIAAGASCLILVVVAAGLAQITPPGSAALARIADDIERNLSFARRVEEQRRGSRSCKPECLFVERLYVVPEVPDTANLQDVLAAIARAHVRGITGAEITAAARGSATRATLVGEHVEIRARALKVAPGTALSDPVREKSTGRVVVYVGARR